MQLATEYQGVTKGIEGGCPRTVIVNSMDLIPPVPVEVECNVICE